ncbi:hypothetical protein AWJ19_19340 [Paenibacillus sp. DMB5]|nr:hypothetical protein AWJ19_19340 [Paenibacillus sp. DMB5]
MAEIYESQNDSTIGIKQETNKATSFYLVARKRKKESAKSIGVIAGTQTSNKSMSLILHKARVNKDLAKQLCLLNTRRGGKYGLKGFLFEHLHASNETA